MYCLSVYQTTLLSTIISILHHDSLMTPNAKLDITDGRGRHTHTELRARCLEKHFKLTSKMKKNIRNKDFGNTLYDLYYI